MSFLLHLQVGRMHMEVQQPRLSKSKPIADDLRHQGLEVVGLRSHAGFKEAREM